MAAIVRVTVRLFARLRELAGASELERTVEAPATIGSVWAGLVQLVSGARAVQRFDIRGAQSRVRPPRRASRGRRRNRVPSAGLWRELERIFG